MPATGVCAPERMLVAVRAMAPVAGKPPNIGEKMLAMPWPISSTLGLWRSLLMRSDTTADISDSMAPSMATVKAGPSRPWTRSHAGMRYREMRQAAGNSAEPRADRFDRQLEQDTTAAVAPSMATIAPGIALEKRAAEPASSATVQTASSVAANENVWERRRQGLSCAARIRRGPCPGAGRRNP